MSKSKSKAMLVALFALQALAQNQQVDTPQSCPTPGTPANVPLPPNTTPDKPTTPTETKHNADPTANAAPGKGVVSPRVTSPTQFSDRGSRAPRVDGKGPVLNNTMRSPAAKESRSRRDGPGRGKR